MIIPIKPINITEEVNKTLIWKQVNENTNKNGLSAVKRTNKKSKERYVNIIDHLQWRIIL